MLRCGPHLSARVLIIARAQLHILVPRVHPTNTEAPRAVWAELIPSAFVRVAWEIRVSKRIQLTSHLVNGTGTNIGFQSMQLLGDVLLDLRGPLLIRRVP